MACFAFALGASAFIIGLMAAIPLLAQLAQLPAIGLVERVRQRRKITVIAVSTSRLIILLLALVPYLSDRSLQLALLLVAQLAITLLGSVSGCSLNSWLHQLLPRSSLGTLFARRLFWSTVLASSGVLVAGQLIQHWPFAESLHAYSVAFAAAGAAGFISSHYLSKVPEPQMPPRAGPALPVLAIIRSPFRDANFRRLILFMGSWNVAANMAAPFLAVYLLRQLGYQMGTVTALWIVSQVANALTLYLWGRISDRLSNKGILAVALPVYFGCIIAFPFAALPEPHALTLPLLVLIHVLMGAAQGGIGLATGNLGLKLAPQGQGTAYLANVTLIGSLSGGVASVLGGALAGGFEAAKLTLVLQWTSLGGGGEFAVLRFQHWEFLFGLSFLLGFYVLHALSRIREGTETSQREVMQHFMTEAARSLDQFSPLQGLRTVLLFPIGWLAERRKRPRSPQTALQPIPRSAP